MVSTRVRQVERPLLSTLLVMQRRMLMVVVEVGRMTDCHYLCCARATVVVGAVARSRGVNVLSLGLLGHMTPPVSQVYRNQRKNKKK